MAGPLSLAINAVNQIGSTMLENSFQDVATISRPGTTLSDYGTSTPSYSNVAAAVPCSWKPASNDAKEYIRALKLTAVSTYAIEFAIGVDVKAEDRITIAARGQEPAHTFEVKGPAIIKPGVSLYVLCTLQEN